MNVDLGANLEPFSIQGSWWLPDRESHPVGGTLSFDAEGQIMLVLVGRLNPAQEPSLSPPRYPTVLGRTDRGGEVTLCNSLALERPVTHQVKSESVYRRETVTAGLMFVGAHLPDGVETMFEAVSCQFDNLAEWGALEALMVPEFEEELVNYRLAGVQGFESQLESGTLRLFVGAKVQEGQNDFSAQRTASFRVDLDEPQTYRNILDKVERPLQQFITFACDTPCHLVELLFYSSAFSYSQVQSVAMPIRAIYRGATKHRSDQYDSYMLLHLKDVCQDFEHVMRRWFERWEKHSPALDLLFDTLLGPQTYLETRFLLLAQAAEVYSRLRFPEQQARSNDHNERRKRITDSVTDPEDNSWLRDALTYYKEPTYKDKLDGLLTHVGSHHHNVTRSEFANIVKATRNYYTHYDDQSKKKAVTESADLSRLAQEVTSVLVLCILRDLDFDEGQSWSYFTRTRQWRSMH